VDEPLQQPRVALEPAGRDQGAGRAHESRRPVRRPQPGADDGAVLHDELGRLRAQEELAAAVPDDAPAVVDVGGGVELVAPPERKDLLGGARHDPGLPDPLDHVIERRDQRSFQRRVAVRVVLVHHLDGRRRPGVPGEPS
jgi:hypothetical protein